MTIPSAELPTTLIFMMMDYLRPECMLCDDNIKFTDSNNPDKQACRANCGHKFHRSCITQQAMIGDSYFCPHSNCHVRIIFLHGPNVHLLFESEEYTIKLHLCPKCRYVFKCFFKLDNEDEKSRCSCIYYHCDGPPVPRVQCPWRLFFRNNPDGSFPLFCFFFFFYLFSLCVFCVFFLSFFGYAYTI
jgi:hypothetical protein